jgi:hypothetical protein
VLPVSKVASTVAAVGLFKLCARLSLCGNHESANEAVGLLQALTALASMRSNIVYATNKLNAGF